MWTIEGQTSFVESKPSSRRTGFHPKASSANDRAPYEPPSIRGGHYRALRRFRFAGQPDHGDESGRGPNSEIEHLQTRDQVGLRLDLEHQGAGSLKLRHAEVSHLFGRHGDAAALS